MIQTGLRFHDSAAGSFEERVGFIKAQGFDCTHIALSKVPGLTSDRAALTPGYAACLKHVFDKNEMSVAVLGCYLNLGNPDSAQLKEVQKNYMAHLRLASMLGAGVVGTETGAPNTTYTCDESCQTKGALDLFVEHLRPVIKAAEDFGVILAIEPVYKHIVSGPKRARYVLDAIGSPNLRIIFDAVNLLDPKYLTDSPDGSDAEDAYISETLDEMIDLVGEEVDILHLKDYTYENSTMTSMGCGLGRMKYDKILRFALDKKPFIQATFEDTKPDNAEGCRKYILDIQDRLLQEK